MNTKELLELIAEGQITEDRIDESARRILRTKFQLGLFDNPYVNVEKAVMTVGKKEFMEKGKIAQRKSIVLLKNEMEMDSSFVLPLQSNIKIYIENINKEVASQYATVVDNLNDADYAVIRLQTPWDPRDGNMVESFFHQGRLNFNESELSRILNIAQSKPTIICMYMDRPAVIPEISAETVGLLADFGAHDDAVLDIVFGRHNPTAVLPFEIPSSVEAVEKQFEDLPYDSENPLYPYGHGLRYNSID